MRMKFVVHCFVAMGLLFSPQVIAANDAVGPLKAGAAVANITPFFDEPIVGNFTTPPTSYIHDDLFARSIVLDDGQTRLAIVLADNVGISRNVFDHAKDLASKATGIPLENILTAATHTHSGTSARTANSLVTDVPLTFYEQVLARRISDSIRQAVVNLEPAEIAWGSVEAPEHVFNRRWLMKADSASAKNPFGGLDRVRMNPGRSPDRVEPAGPVDPKLMFFAVRSVDGRPIALFGNYSLHYIGGVPTGHISADYFALFGQYVGEILGVDSSAKPEFVGIMSNGASGDINNIDLVGPAASFKPYEKMKVVAKDLAEKVAAEYKGLEFRREVPLKAAKEELVLKVRKPTAEQVSYAQEILAKAPDAPKYHPVETHYANRTLQLQDSPETVSVPIQSMRIGDLAFCAIPFEVFAETGLEIREKSPFPATFTIGQANGTYGYLPANRHFELGGYETWVGTNRVEPKADQKITETVFKQFEQLK